MVLQGTRGGGGGGAAAAAVNVVAHALSVMI